MICRKCGANVPDGMAYCHKCGTPMSASPMNQPVNQPPMGAPAVQPMNQPPMGRPVGQPINQPPMGAPVGQPMGAPMGQPPMGQPPKKKTGLIIGIAAGAFALVAIIVTIIIVIVVKNSGINASDYINRNIDVYGYDGYGYAYESDVVNYSRLMSDLTGSALSNSDMLDDYITVTFDDSNEKLSNGDTLTATITINYNAINSMNFKKKLKGNAIITQSYTITGLEEVAVLNPHDALSAVYYSPSLDSSEVVFNEYYNSTVAGCSVSVSDNEIDIYYGGSYVDSVHFFVDSSTYATTGKIQLETSCYPEEFLESYGFVVQPEFKDVEPTIVDYLMYNSVNQSDYDYIKSYADYKFANDSYYVNGYFVGAYFACNDEYSYDKNAIIFIYGYDSWWDNSTNYMAYKFEDFMVDTSTNEIMFFDTPYIQEIAYDCITVSNTLDLVEYDYSYVGSLNVK